MADDKTHQSPSPATPNTNIGIGRKRKMKQSIPTGASFVWAREGGHKGAKEHPAHLLVSPPLSALSSALSALTPSGDAASGSSAAITGTGSEGNVGNNDNENDQGEELVWVQWASNGTVSQIPKSNIVSSGSGLSPRTRRRTISPNDIADAGITPTTTPRKRSRSRLSLTKKQRTNFKEHHHHENDKRKSLGSGRKSRKEDDKNDKQPLHLHDVHPQQDGHSNSKVSLSSESLDSHDSTKYRVKDHDHDILRKSNDQETSVESTKSEQKQLPWRAQQQLARDSKASSSNTVSVTKSSPQSTSNNDDVAGNYSSFVVAAAQSPINENKHKKQQQPSSSSASVQKRSPEIVVINIIDSDDDEEGEEKKEYDVNRTTITSNYDDATTRNLCSNNFDMTDITCNKGKVDYSQSERDDELKLKQSPSSIDYLTATSKSAPLENGKHIMNRLQNPVPASSLSSLQPELPTSLIPPLLYTHRSSAYVQHLAEACTLIMTDARWRTFDRDAALFSWERGDDLSAVKAFVSLYDEKIPKSEVDAEDGDGDDDDGKCTGSGSERENESEPKEQQDEVFERSMHLYSRMFHRKGPWFDLADLYIRYYAPKSTTNNKQMESTSMEQEEESASPRESLGGRTGSEEDAARKKDNEKVKGFFTPKSSSERESLDGSMGSEEDAARNKDNEQIKGFFTPKSSSNSTRRTSSNNSINRSNNDLHCHQTPIEQLFRDILRLLSMGLIRTFQSEYEAGSVAGHITSSRRGMLLSAEERREILRRLGGGKSPKVARRASGTSRNGGGNGSSKQSSSTTNNEILNQMQSQQTVMSSFAQTHKGGQGKTLSMLPVIKHVDKVLIRKLAVKVSSLVTDAPRKSEIEEASNIIRRAWAAAHAYHDNENANVHAPNLNNSVIASTFRLREAPLKTLRRCTRLFLCAGGGPGRMRGDGTNGWISVLGDEPSADPSASSSSWHNVAYPGLSSRLGLEHYEFGHCYAPLSLASQSEGVESKEVGATKNLASAAIGSISRVFTRHCEFQLWEMGVEMRSFVDLSAEAYEIEKMVRRRREKELSKLESNGHEAGMLHDESVNGTNSTIPLLTFDGSVLLTEEGRSKLVRNIMILCFYEGELSKHVTLDSAISGLCLQIEADILLLSNNTADGDSDGFISDTERMIAAKAVICHRILQLRIRHPSMMLISIVERPWLRHMCFDAILAYILWDGVPFFERRGHHAMAVSILQTVLFGQTLCEFSDLLTSSAKLGQGAIRVEPYIQCLLPRRNRGKAYERVVIDITHADRRNKKATQQKAKKKARKSSSNDKGSANEEKQPLPIQTISNALLRNAESFGSIPYCSLRNLARRSKAPLPHTNERSTLHIRPNDDSEWSPKTDCAIANAIYGESDDSAVGKRCAFVGWEMQDGQGETMEAKRSLNVEELAMEEYHSGRLPCDEDTEEVKGKWVGWHNEGGHVRALFRILCLQHMLEHCPQDSQGSDEQTSIFLTPYQSSPHDLHVGCFKTVDSRLGSPIRGFYERHSAAIESFFSKLSQSDECGISEVVYQAVKRRWERHADDRSRMKDTRLLRDVKELKTLSMIAGALGPTALARIFRTLSFDYRHWSGGLPDLMLVRARYASIDQDINSDSLFVDLADWIGEGFSTENIEEKNIQGQINMLIDRDDEFLGCSKCADGSASQQQSLTRNKKGPASTELPSFPEKLEFIHNEKRVKADCMFVEVKSANDRLSERQEDWLSILENCTNARVCKFNSNSSNKK